MRISDWSSDVCSSDLHLPRVARQRLKAVEVLRQELAGELAGNAAVAEGNRVVLVAADDEAPASILLVVDEAIGIAQGRQVGRDAGDRLGPQVLGVDRAGGQVPATSGAPLAAPQARGPPHRPAG